MSVVSRPGEPLAMVCDRCGCEWPRPELDSSDLVRIDAAMHGWIYVHDANDPDQCPMCNGQWAYEDELTEVMREMREEP